MTATEDAQNCHQQEVSGRNAHRRRIRASCIALGVSDQVEIGCNRVAFKLREEEIPPTYKHADSTGKSACKRFYIALGALAAKLE